MVEHDCFFASDEPYSTGMLEAALIHKYQSVLSGHGFFLYASVGIRGCFSETYKIPFSAKPIIYIYISNLSLPSSAKVGLAVAMFDSEGIL